MIIRVIDGENREIASATGDQDAFLCLDRVYQAGDVIEIEGGTHLCVQMDQAMPKANVFLPEGKMRWLVPHGEHRLAYAPGAFENQRHLITAEWMTEEQIHTQRNIALNPADLRGDVNFFPHCTANAETRGESVFCVRNVINGIRANTGHGEWPYLSWGVDICQDPQALLEFGRPVRVTRMALTLRADFPHDAYWKSGAVELSDGATVEFELGHTGERQYVDLGEHTITWIRLGKLVKGEDPSPFPALTEWEIFGCDA